jgi:DNA-binding NarL/FixJ family response regulator
MAHPGGPPADAGVIRLVLADDEARIRTGWSTMLSTAADLLVVGEAGNGAEAARLGRDADVVLMDIRMPVLDGLAATAELGRTSPRTRVIVVTTFEHDSLVWGALRAGAAGYVLKRAPARELVDAIRLVHRSDAVLYPDALSRVAAAHRSGDGGARSPLTARQLDVLKLVARGLSNQRIAEELHIGAETVKTHVENIRDCLHARDRTHAVVLAYERGILIPGLSLDP